MLKGIPKIISPELLKILAEMGHGDEIVIADGNFPAAGNARILVRADGHGACELLEAILILFPLDTYVENPVTCMKVVEGDTAVPVIWEDFRKSVKAYSDSEFEFLERNAFYEKARKAFAIIATGESALYANLILKKGVIK